MSWGSASRDSIAHLRMKHQSAIRFRTLLITGFLILVAALGAVGMLTYQLAFRAVTERVKDSERQLVYGIADRVDATLTIGRTVLDVLSTDPAVQAIVTRHGLSGEVRIEDIRSLWQQ